MPYEGCRKIISSVPGSSYVSSSHALLPPLPPPSSSSSFKNIQPFCHYFGLTMMKVVPSLWEWGDGVSRDRAGEIPDSLPEWHVPFTGPSQITDCIRFWYHSLGLLDGAPPSCAFDSMSVTFTAKLNKLNWMWAGVCTMCVPESQKERVSRGHHSCPEPRFRATETGRREGAVDRKQEGGHGLHMPWMV